MVSLQRILLLLYVARVLCANVAKESCEFPIRRSRVLSAWQSSDLAINFCFHTRSHIAEEYHIKSAKSSFLFAHSNNRSQADSGFHWFAVQLNESVLIRSVTVKGREDGTSFIYPRARGIEIWTSGSSSQMFSGDHCSSKSMSRQFTESKQHWRLCGLTQSKRPEIQAGEIFTVTCLAVVRQLLLRRDIRKADAYTFNDYMSFADLRLQTVRLALEPSGPQLVAENSNFEVRCSLQCGGSALGTNSSELQLCLPNGSSSADHRLQIGSAQPLHSGNYTCKFGSVEKATSVTVLSASPHQVVAENSSFTVSCQLHCGDEASCMDYEKWRRTLLLCLPIGSCTADPRLQVASAQPHHSGIYLCKAGSKSKASTVTVLSSSPDQLVAENSSFTVSCELHCNGADLSTVSSRMKLCTPGGSCTENHTIETASAQPLHSGSYTCRLDSVERQTEVTVLYPPSSVAISAMNSDSCSELSDVVVQFRSSASQPVSEHRCSADAGGLRVLNLTRLSLNSNGNGSVSLWKLASDEEERLEWRNITVECSAVQALPAGIQFGAMAGTEAQLHCSGEPSKANRVGWEWLNNTGKNACFSLIGLFSAALAATFIFGLAYSMRPCSQRTSPEAMELNSVQRTADAELQPDDGPVQSEFQVQLSYSEPVCSYAFVRPARADSPEQTDCDSDCTDYIAIVADGD